MLERIEIRNFQTHEHTRLAFAPGVTTITGPTDVGKSAIIRALQWVATNRPNGTEYIRWGTDRCRVTLWADGHRVRRTRGPEANEYGLDDSEYRAFGNDVPPAIAALLNIDDNNFQEQISDPFWLTVPPGQVAKNLNSIVNLGIIDEAIAYLGTAQRRAATGLELAEAAHVKARQEAKTLAWVPACVRDWEAVKMLGGAATAARAYHTALAALVATARQYGQRAARAKKMATAGRAVVALGNEAGRARRHATLLARLLNSIRNTKQQIRRPPDIRPLKKTHDELSAIRIKLLRFAELLDAIREARDRLHTKKDQAALARTKFTIEVGDTCPICQRPLKSSPSSPATST